MNTFVIVAAKPGRALAREVTERLLTGRPHLTYEATDEHRWTDPRGAVVLRAWERPAPALGIRSFWHQGPGGVTTFTGHVWPRPGGWAGSEPWAEQLAARCAAGTVRDHAEGLTGVYSMVTLDADGRGWALSDPLGLRLLYVGETTNYTVCASRADAAAWALDPAAARPAVDPLGTAWLPYVGYLVGDRTGFAGVRTLPQGTALDLRPDQGATTRSWSAAPWIGDEVEATPQELVAAVRQEIADHLRVVVGLPAAATVCGLTGGKDSRLILSVLLAEGLAHEVDFLTVGDERVEDVEVARRLAERYQLRHRWGRQGATAGHPADNRPRDPAERARVAAERARPYAERAGCFVRDTCGMRNLWDQGGAMTGVDEVQFSGYCGETLRTNYPLMTGVRSNEELTARFNAGLRFGSPGFARPDAWAALQGEALATLLDDRGHPASPLDLIDVFFLANRMRRWFGTAAEIDRSNRFVPLYSLTGLRAAFALGVSRRREQFLHREVMRAAWPELVDLPFAGSGWPDPLPAAPVGREPAELPGGIGRAGPTGPTGSLRRLTHSGAVRRARRAARRWAGPAAPAPPTAGGPLRTPGGAPAGARPVTANQAFQQRSLAERRPLLEDALGGALGEQVFEVVDRDAARAALGRLEQLDLQERIRLFGAATAALWLAEPGAAVPGTASAIDPARAVP